MRPALAIPIVVIALVAVCPAAPAVGQAQTLEPDAIEVVHALLRDLVVPHRDRLSGSGPTRTIAFASATLARCESGRTGKVVPCIGAVLDTAASEAAKGAWSRDLVSEFEKQNTASVDLAGRLGALNVPGLVMGPRDELLRSHPTSLPLAISRPIAVNGQSLLAVRFARTWVWLVHLSKRSAGWKVERTVTVGIS
jgi:hypothetical protein